MTKAPFDLFEINDTYEDRNFIIFIRTYKSKYEAWIQHKDYGVISYMFGMLIDTIEYDRFEKLVLKNVKDYELMYMDEYGD